MPFYDGIQTSFQLGNDLQLPIPSVPIIDVAATGSDVSPAGQEFSGYPPAYICEHAGSLFVAYVQSTWDGETYFTSDFNPGSGVTPLFLASGGPYVKQYNPGSDTWELVGDPIEPTLFPALADGFFVSFGYTTYPDNVHHGSSASFAIGTRFAPSRVVLASDGTSLYLCYSLHITQADPHDPTHQVMSPFTLLVRRWNGSTWELYGQIDPVGQQDDQSDFLAGSSLGSAWGGINLAASPLEPGAVYASLVQGGLDTNRPTFSRPGNYLYQGVVARYDGSSIAGTVKAIGNPTVGTGDGHGGATFVYGAYFYGLTVRYDDANGPLIFYAATLQSDDPASPTLASMVRWSDMAVLQSIPTNTGPIGPGGQQIVLGPSHLPRGYEGSAYLLDIDTGPPAFPFYLRDWSSDGSGPSAPLDGVVPELQEPTAGTIKVEPDLPNNIWTLTRQGKVWLYHRPCRAWTHIQFTALGATGPVDGENFPFCEGVDLVSRSGHYFSVFAPQWIDFIVRDGSIYVAAWLLNIDTEGFRDVPPEVVLRVYKAPIQRNEYQCRNVSLHIFDRFTVVP